MVLARKAFTAWPCLWLAFIDRCTSIHQPLMFHDFHQVCAHIENTISSASSVYYPGSDGYKQGLHHHFNTSIELSACVIEPGTAQDVGITLRIVGSTKTPFAIKGGGHGRNIGFSSTRGVHITMVHFKEISYNATASTATVGAGATWDELYSALYAYKMTVVGGRVGGVGVAGVTLGGGYSSMSNMYGLAIDNVVAYELVLPNGTVRIITRADEDLWFGLGGGFNNFGIVTKITFRTYPQPLVWGGRIVYDKSHIEAVNIAISKYDAKLTDRKSFISITYDNSNGKLETLIEIAHYAPTPPAGLYDEFLAIPSIYRDLKTSPHPLLRRASDQDRGTGHTVSFAGYSPSLLRAIVNESEFWGRRIAPYSGTWVMYSLDPVMPDMLSRHVNNGRSPSAYPPTRTRAFSPFWLIFTWHDPAFDADMRSFIKESADHLTRVAIAEGQDIQGAALYPNYAIDGTGLEKMYGHHLTRLREIRTVIDPEGVMQLAGGWKF